MADLNQHPVVLAVRVVVPWLLPLLVLPIMITRDLPQHEFLGEHVRNQLIYYPTVTREAFRNSGRITTLIESGDLATVVGLPALDPQNDRFMLCGSPAMLDDCAKLLDARGFEVASRIGDPGHYVIERAFVEK